MPSPSTQPSPLALDPLRRQPDALDALSLDALDGADPVAVSLADCLARAVDVIARAVVLAQDGDGAG